jgi:hypothetical protein
MVDKLGDQSAAKAARDAGEEDAKGHIDTA